MIRRASISRYRNSAGDKEAVMKTIYLAGGCFWGTEHYMRQFEGVVETVVGYANGTLADPSYQEVYTDQTGHVECVKVVYDEALVSLQTLCRMFFRSIDPLLLNRQGGDVGTRYRTGIYWVCEEDKEAVEQVWREWQSRFTEPLAVEKQPLTCFYSAEEYHQGYLLKNPEGYCHLSLETLTLAKQYSKICCDLRKCSTEEKREILPRFFKTGKGEYGEGDRFIGVVVPDTRKVAKLHKDASYEVLEALLESEWHEVRLCALVILTEMFRKEPEAVVEFYLRHTEGINNWDLVDLSAPYILGAYLVDKEDRKILYRLSESANMWEQRISIVSTLMLIRHGQFADTMNLAEHFLYAKHDLMQKATGWMLREVGKRDEALLTAFLERHKSTMPRTMLRYAIEKFSPEQRRYFMRR